MDPVFWMGGVSASSVVELRSDLEALREPGFWVILGSFEGRWTFARCAGVEWNKSWPEETSKLVIGDWSSSLDVNSYLEYVLKIKAAISAGEVYQVNACRILSAEIMEDCGLRSLMTRILKDNPAPFASYLSLPEVEIASASPERFLSLKDGWLTSSPIKGTSRSAIFPDKDRAENLMIVDLMRNDIGKIAETGSVVTPRLLATEEHPGLFHLVSDIKGRISEGITFDLILKALMPPGSVSGAPKSSALQIIRDNERERGPYCGAIGWYQDGRAEIAVGIRTFWRSERQLNFGTGAGITWESDPLSEWEETELKASKLLSLIEKIGNQ
jgi:para-aminobenzoate synthetase component 1